MKNHIRRFTKKALTGIITGAADNDPSGITSYSISASLFGYSQLWLMLLATPMLIAVQSMSARIANVARTGIATVLKSHFSPLVAWLATGVLVVANVFTIGADILAVALAFEMLTGIALIWWVLPVTAGVWYLVLFKNYKTLRKFFVWMVFFFLSYVVAALLAHPDWQAVILGLVRPDLKVFSKEYFTAAVAILGTTITPYLFFWEAKETLEENRSKESSLREAINEDRINTPGFVFSQCITSFIMIATGATLFRSGISINTAADAAKALEPLAGHWASALFAVGIIGAGLLALPVLSVCTAEVIAETANFRHHDLNNKVKSAKAFYAVVTASLLAGLLIMLFGFDPLRALFYSQVLAGVLAPFLIVLILIAANRKDIMGNYTNRWFDNTFGLLALLVMSAATVLMFLS
ncbi:MAG: divalent metal cation transporter [Patescibacteria group bacterium]|nr:divalent metal cation transporter [Patescibacteria group bacterium]